MPGLAIALVPHKAYAVSTMHTPDESFLALRSRPLATRKTSRFRTAIIYLAAVSLVAPALADDAKPAQGLAPIRAYISTGWDTLTRSMNECGTVVDTKLAATSVMYLPANFPEPAALKELQKTCKFEVRHLPAVIHHPGEVDANALNPPGLLYPRKSLRRSRRPLQRNVRLGQLLHHSRSRRDGRTDLARGMVENFFFEIEHYGNVLNANRSYYLSRSQPPFLTSMILSVYDSAKSQRPRKQEMAGARLRLRRQRSRHVDSRPAPRGRHRPVTLFRSRRWPVPRKRQGRNRPLSRRRRLFHASPRTRRSLSRPQGTRQHHAADFRRTIFRARLRLRPRRLATPPPRIRNHAECEIVEDVALAAEFYKGDRSMRESGYDISFRFGPYGAGTTNYAPVCLNSLLYKTEKDLEQMSRSLGHPEEANKWKDLAETRKAQMQKHLWDEQRGMFFDYNFAKTRTLHLRVRNRFRSVCGPAWQHPNKPKPSSIMLKSSNAPAAW